MFTNINNGLMDKLEGEKCPVIREKFKYWVRVKRGGSHELDDNMKPWIYILTDCVSESILTWLLQNRNVKILTSGGRFGNARVLCLAYPECGTIV